MRRVVWLGLVVFLLTGGLAFGQGAVFSQSDSFDLSLSPSVDVPTRTVEFDNRTFEISAVGRVQPGERLSVRTTAPSNATYRILIYNADRQRVDFKTRTGDTTVSFDTGGYQVGSYIVTIQYDGTFRTVQPLVIAGYTVDVDAPREGYHDETIRVEANVTKVAGNRAKAGVELVIENRQEELRTQLSAGPNGSYVANVSLSTLSPEGPRYTLYIVVEGSKEAYGRTVLLGISDSHPFSLVERTTTSARTTSSASPTTSATTTGSTTDATTTGSPTTTTTTGGDTTDDGTGSSGGQATTTGHTPTSTSGTATTTDPPASPTTDSPTRSGSPPLTDTTAPTTTPPSESSTTDSTSVTTSASVVLPNTSPSVSTVTSTPGQPIPLYLPALAIWVVAFLLYRTRKD